jgi:hypothetical protein
MTKTPGPKRQGAGRGTAATIYMTVGEVIFELR